MTRDRLQNFILAMTVTGLLITYVVIGIQWMEAVDRSFK